jgi:transcription elongation GreA/GreB family factor
LSQLNNTQFELTTKVLAIEEEKREMRKRIDEMKAVCDLKEAKETLMVDINNLDTRVAQLKKQLGKGQSVPVEEKEKKA